MSTTDSNFVLNIICVFTTAAPPHQVPRMTRECHTVRRHYLLWSLLTSEIRYSFFGAHSQLGIRNNGIRKKECFLYIACIFKKAPRVSFLELWCITRRRILLTNTTKIVVSSDKYKGSLYLHIMSSYLHMMSSYLDILVILVIIAFSNLR